MKYWDVVNQMDNVIISQETGIAYRRGPCADGSVGFGGKVWTITYLEDCEELDTLFELGKVPEGVTLDAAVVVAAVR